MSRRLALVAAVSFAFVATPAFAAHPTVAVTACGQVIPRGAVGQLAADLDCTGFVDTLAAVIVSNGATLDLGGFTLTGGQFNVVCGDVETDSFGQLSADPLGRCTIRRGTLREAGAHGAMGGKLQVVDVRVENAGQEGVYALKRASFENVTITGSGGQGARVDGRALVRGSTISGSAEEAIVARSLRALDSDLRGNGAGPQCPAAFNCADIRTPTRPAVIRTACNLSRGAGATSYGGWGVCLLD